MSLEKLLGISFELTSPLHVVRTNSHSISAIFKVALGCLMFIILMIFRFYKSCYKFIIVLFCDHTIIYIQYDKNKDRFRHTGTFSQTSRAGLATVQPQQVITQTISCHFFLLSALLPVHVIEKKRYCLHSFFIVLYFNCTSLTCSHDFVKCTKNLVLQIFRHPF